MMRPIVCRGFSDAYESLKDHLHAGPKLTQLLFIQSCELYVAQPHLPRSGTMQLQHCPSCRGFSAPALADESECFACEELKAHPIDGLDRHVFRFSGEMLCHVHNAKYGFHRIDYSGCRPCRVPNVCIGIAGITHVVALPLRHRRNKQHAGQGSARTAVGPRSDTCRTRRAASGEWAVSRFYKQIWWQPGNARKVLGSLSHLG